MRHFELQRPIKSQDILLWHVSGTQESGARRDAFQRIWNWLKPAIRVAPSAVPRLANQIAFDVESAIMASQDYTIEVLDNWINKGDEYGGQVWLYLEDDKQMRPTGRPSEKIRGRLTSAKRDRKFCGLEIEINHVTYQVVLPNELQELARVISFFRYKMDTTERTAAQAKKRDATASNEDEPQMPEPKRAHATTPLVSLDVLAAQGKEPAGPNEPEEALLKKTAHNPNGSSWLADHIATAYKTLAKGRTGNYRLVPQRLRALTAAFLAYVADCCSGHSSPAFFEWIVAITGAADCDDGWAEFQSWIDQAGQSRWAHLMERADAMRLDDTASIENRIHYDRWLELVDPDLERRGSAPAGARPDALLSLYGLWHRACMALIAGESDGIDAKQAKQQRAALDTAKHRLDESGDLDAFYAVLGELPPGKRRDGEGGGGGDHIHNRVRQRFDWLLSGAIMPSDAAEARDHLAECPDCFWAFSDYADERRAWGCSDSPLTAYVREAWYTRAELFENVSRIVDSWSDLVRLPVQPRPLLIPTGLSEAEGSPAPHCEFIYGDAPVRIGSEIDVEPLSLDPAAAPGNARPGAYRARIASMQTDPSEGSVGITLACDEWRGLAGVLVANLVVKNESEERRCSLASEIGEGQATLSLTDSPDTVSSMIVTRCYLAELEPEPASS